MSAGAIAGAGAVGAGADSGGFGALSSDEFIKVLMAELTNQDPFEPQDSGALLEQMSSLRNIESQLSLQDKLDSLEEQFSEIGDRFGNLGQQLEGFVLQNELSAAGNLIGKLVEGTNTDDQSIQGLVTSVRVEGGNTFLELDTGAKLAMNRVTRVT